MTYVHPKLLFYKKQVVDGDPKADGPLSLSDGNTQQTSRLDLPAQAMSKARESPDPKFLTPFPNLHKSSNILKWLDFIARLQWKNSSGIKVSHVDLRCFCLGAECRVTRWQDVSLPNLGCGRSQGLCWDPSGCGSGRRFLAA